jgi:DNA modification methylase
VSVRILIGDVRERLAALPADHFDCVVTSPPYWGLRDYDVAGQIGLEPTVAEHLAVMVDVFREVRRVLKPSGVCWMNYGDCYATSPNGRSAAATKAAGNDDRTFRDKPFSTIGGVLKPKDLCLLPQRLTIALQEDGWWIRSLLPWVKRNGMPESISDRPATSVEYVTMMTKSARYAYDADAVRRAASPATNARVAQDVSAQAGSTRANGGRKTNGPMKAVVRRPKVADAGSGIKSNESYECAMSGAVLPDRNFRNTDLFFDSLTAPFGLISGGDGSPLAIDVNPQGFSEAHFATFPPGLVEPLLRAGCPLGGRVLDPFGGSGTTGMVADRLGLDCTLIELNPDYAEIARGRIEGDAGMFSAVEVAA